VQELNPNGGAVTNQEPSLKVTGDIVRSQITTFNDYKNIAGQQYSSQHPNAQSDGDEQGRGEANTNGGVGTLTDIQRKNTLIYQSGNKYKPGINYYNFNFGEQYW
jgi:hypothetical protein